MDWTSPIIKIYCLIKGLKVRSLTTDGELEEAFDLRNRVYQEVYHFKPVEPTKEVIRPKGLAFYVGVYQKGKLVGCLRLMDITQISPFVSFFYKNPNLDKPFNKTYEMAGLVVEPKLQSTDSHIFFILLYYAFQFTLKNGRQYWLASTWKSLYQYIKRMGGIAQFITDEVGFVDDGSPKASFLKNYLENGNANDYCCYYVTLPKKYDKVILKKYFSKKKRQLWKRWSNAFPTMKFRGTKGVTVIGKR
ncbi:MAG: hypothetical protein AAFZ15_11985 [Bacteroidota bacterium]